MRDVSLTLEITAWGADGIAMEGTRGSAEAVGSSPLHAHCLPQPWPPKKASSKSFHLPKEASRTCHPAENQYLLPSFSLSTFMWVLPIEFRSPGFQGKPLHLWSHLAGPFPVQQNPVSLREVICVSERLHFPAFVIDQATDQEQKLLSSVFYVCLCMYAHKCVDVYE